MDTEKTVATEVVEQPVQEATEAPAENAAPRAERRPAATTVEEKRFVCSARTRLIISTIRIQHASESSFLREVRFFLAVSAALVLSTRDSSQLQLSVHV